MPHGGGFIEWRNDCNGPVAWCSRRLKFPPDSTCHGELGGLAMMLKEARFTVNLLIDMMSEVSTPHLITDSKSAFDIVRNPGVTKRSVHYERILHIVRDAFLQNQIRIFLTTTDKMMADNMTKVVDREKFFRCRNYQMNI